MTASSLRNKLMRAVLARSMMFGWLVAGEAVDCQDADQWLLIQARERILRTCYQKVPRGAQIRVRNGRGEGKVVPW